MGIITKECNRVLHNNIMNIMPCWIYKNQTNYYKNQTLGNPF